MYDNDEFPKQCKMMAIFHGGNNDDVFEDEHTHFVFEAHPQNKLRVLKNIAKYIKGDINELLTTCQIVKNAKHFFAYLKSHQIRQEFIGNNFNEELVQTWNNVDANDMACSLANREERSRKRAANITENVTVKRQKIINLVDIIDEYNIVNPNDIYTKIPYTLLQDLLVYYHTSLNTVVSMLLKSKINSLTFENRTRTYEENIINAKW